jgi:RNA polymerase sigma-70 factor (ECF subfamily)
MTRTSDTRGKAHLTLVETEPASAPVVLDFDAVYESQVDFVWRTLRLLGVPREQVEDTAQEVFGVIARQLPSFAGRSALRTWVYAIAQKVAANQRRGQRRKQAPLEPLGERVIVALDAGPDLAAEALEAARRIEGFCAGLDESWRAVFVLVLLEEVPAPEVAEALSLPLNTVYSRVRTLRQELRRWLERCEVERG